MPPKMVRKKGKGADEGGKKGLETKESVVCHSIIPGPKYELKTLTGYKGHCVSRYRNPAYTFGGYHAAIKPPESPGPKYMIKERKLKGFTFGHVMKHRDLDIGPGPKYKLPDASRGPFFSMKWRTEHRKISKTPGPYYIKPTADAPTFFIGLHAPIKPETIAGPYSPCNLEAIKPRIPKYTIVGRRPLRIISKSPGPIYALPSYKLTPAFSFGIKHSKCAPPYITECDAQCQ